VARTQVPTVPVDVSFEMMPTNNELVWHADDTPLDVWLDTIWLVPSVNAGGTIGGKVIAASTPLAGSLAQAFSLGMVKISIRPGMDVTTGPATESTLDNAGAFTVYGNDPGMYTITVSTTKPGLVLAGTAFNVLFNANDLELDVVVVAAAGNTDDETHAVLSWNMGSGFDQIAMKLHSVFELSGSDCTVEASADQCGGVTYSDLGGSSSTMTFASWRANTAYGLYATIAQRSCKGIGLDSNAGLAGGAATVSCQGDCTTGENYCYSTNDGALCANCKIFGSSALPSCFDYGEPQGGLDGKNPGSAAFNGDTTCDASNLMDNSRLGNPCLGRLMYSVPKIRIFSKGELVRETQIPGPALQSDAGGSAAVWLGCIDTEPCDSCNSGLTIQPDFVLPKNPGLTSQQLINIAPTTSCSEHEYASQAWSCGENTFACTFAVGSTLG